MDGHVSSGPHFNRRETINGKKVDDSKTGSTTANVPSPLLQIDLDQGTAMERSPPPPSVFFYASLSPLFSVHRFSSCLPVPSLSFLPCGSKPRGGMSGAHRVQEIDHSGGGVVLVVSLDGVNWFHRKRCRDKGRTKRNEDLQFWISSGQMALVDEKRQLTTRESSERDRKLRRSVSFDDDVMVLLFDQEGPTMELRPEPSTSLPNTATFNLPDVPLDDCGLEWEDDFSALEWSWHLQRVSRSLHSTLSPSTPSWTAASRLQRYLPSQTCLFLTHVAESDLELRRKVSATSKAC
ncbi:unnamed protein product [Pleuronectes platessa]|uniref:Uncharacterized protein n=1 Tax=Pleuronectes platessa TaxID=8262 RepID=A0A9N7VEI2_PLEPL|nr:unnamed protein product [Pleuronectes platessa]